MMSHGEQGSILDCDGNPVPIQDIINQMNPAFLDGKPKVCIIIYNNIISGHENITSAKLAYNEKLAIYCIFMKNEDWSNLTPV